MNKRFGQAISSSSKLGTVRQLHWAKTALVLGLDVGFTSVHICSCIYLKREPCMNLFILSPGLQLIQFYVTMDPLWKWYSHSILISFYKCMLSNSINTSAQLGTQRSSLIPDTIRSWTGSVLSSENPSPHPVSTGQVSSYSAWNVPLCST